MAHTASNVAMLSSEKIKQLNAIDRDVAKLLESAGTAVKALTTVKHESEKGVIQPISIEEQRETFAAASSRYLTLLSAVDIGLRRQINALEDANIIPAEAVSKDSQIGQSVSPVFSAMAGSAPQVKQTTGNRTVVTGGGLGSLDIGWLNSRNDHIGKGMEAELWEAGQKFVVELRHRKDSSEDEEEPANTHTIQESPRVSGQDESSVMDQT